MINDRAAKKKSPKKFVGSVDPVVVASTSMQRGLVSRLREPENRTREQQQKEYGNGNDDADFRHGF